MSAVERIRHEVKEIGLVSLYFLCCFLFFLSLKALILREYEVEISVLSTAAVGALVVAKVVVVLDKTSLGDWFASRRLVINVLWRSLLYTAVVFLVTLAERLFDVYRETGSLSSALSGLWGRGDFDHFLAMNLSVGFFFIVYNVGSEISRHMGPDTLRSLFLSPRGAVPGASGEGAGVRAEG